MPTKHPPQIRCTDQKNNLYSVWTWQGEKKGYLQTYGNMPASDVRRIIAKTPNAEYLFPLEQLDK
jgi:hypothetical protein